MNTITGYDFKGTVTKPGVLCTDGLTIAQDAFAGSVGKKVPLIYGHNYSSPDYVLGYVILQQSVEGGLMGYGFFNETPNAKAVKEQLRHGDYDGMSIGATVTKRDADDSTIIQQGDVFEVSLVLKGANPAAKIHTVVTQSAYGFTEESLEIFGGSSEFEFEDVVTQSATDSAQGKSANKNEGEKMKNEEAKQEASQETGMTEEHINSVLSSLTKEQQDVVDALIAAAIDTDASELDDEEEGDDTVKQNAFDMDKQGQFEITGDMVIQSAIENNTTIGDVLQQAGIAESSKYGIIGMEALFPQPVAKDGLQTYNPGARNVEKIMSSFGRSPMSRVKNMFANLTEDDARARGYITGEQKLDAISSIFYRETTPTTIVRRERMDRDDIIDIKEGGVDVVRYLEGVQLAKLKEEIVRAAILGDGREEFVNGERNRDKIPEDHIRPIITDDDLFTIKVKTNSFETMLDDVTLAMAAYQGSGQPSLYINPFDIAKLKTLKDGEGRYRFGNGVQQGSDNDIAAFFGCKEVVPYFGLPQGKMVIGNLADYEFGSSKDGEIATMNQFDIDFNQEKYLIETRLSGAIKTPKSFIYLTVTNPDTKNEDLIKFNTKGLKQAGNGNKPASLKQENTEISEGH